MVLDLNFHDNKRVILLKVLIFVVNRRMPTGTTVVQTANDLLNPKFD